MNTKTIAVSAIALGMLPLAAEQPEAVKTKTETKIEKTPNGEIKQTTTTRTFTPEVETRVVKWFEQYKTHPHGLPPGIAKKVEVNTIPTTWRTEIEPGFVIEEEQRTYLMPAPQPLISALPERDDSHTYYIAGSNVVAVDSDYAVVESVSIPTLKFESE